MLSKLIDECSEYIEGKDAYYLAKEGQVVYFTSITGRKSDQVWVKHSMTETIRIIRATKLTTDSELREHHVLSAFQELGRVFEFGAKSRHNVSEGVFNFYAHSNTSLANQAAIALSDALAMRGITACLASDVFTLFWNLLEKLVSTEDKNSAKDKLLGVFCGVGFDHKYGSRRVLYKGKKVIVFMLPDTKPRDIVEMPTEMLTQIFDQVYGVLK